MCENDDIEKKSVQFSILAIYARSVSANDAVFRWFVRCHKYGNIIIFRSGKLIHLVPQTIFGKYRFFTFFREEMSKWRSKFDNQNIPGRVVTRTHKSQEARRIYKAFFILCFSKIIVAVLAYSLRIYKPFL